MTQTFCRKTIIYKLNKIHVFILHSKNFLRTYALLRCSISLHTAKTLYLDITFAYLSSPWLYGTIRSVVYNDLAMFIGNIYIFKNSTLYKYITLFI